MKATVVRDAVLKDLSTLLAFEQEIIKAERPYDPTIRPDPVNYYSLKDYIADASVKLLVAEVDERIVGSGYAYRKKARTYLDHEDYAYLGFMYVVPEYRGRGINQQIVDGLKDWALSEGLIEVRLTVYQDNLPAIKAYEKSGFNSHLNEMRIRLKK